MEIGNQIKGYRAQLSMSQEELAEKLYVSRQTVSNWENNKSYPDIHSLLLMSALFGVSLDTLIKGDLNNMKNEINKENIRDFNRSSLIFTILMLLMMLSVLPLYIFWELKGLLCWLPIVAVTFVYAFKVEKLKKRYDIHTYKEIVAFTEGKQLDEISRQQEKGKRPYQSVLLYLASALVGAVLAMIAGLLRLQF